MFGQKYFCENRIKFVPLYKSLSQVKGKSNQSPRLLKKKKKKKKKLITCMYLYY